MNKGELFSIYYHDIFDYCLNTSDIKKWEANSRILQGKLDFRTIQKSGFYFLRGRELLMQVRKKNEVASQKKLIIAKKSAKILGYIPTIEMVAITGSLAMGNSKASSDIDLMIISRPGTLWISRALGYLLIRAFGIKVRKPGKSVEKDRLCMNIWLDEGDLVFSERNFYTAHEIAQIRPILDRHNTYQRFLDKNKWLLDFWPNSVRITNKSRSVQKRIWVLMPLEWFAYRIQFIYMRHKITKETIKPTRALFHPKDWGKSTIEKLKGIS